jgi:hypothetical protein
MTHRRDRADVVARAILDAVADHIRDDGAALHARIADQLRDEFADVARTALTEIRLNDE